MAVRRIAVPVLVTVVFATACTGPTGADRSAPTPTPAPTIPTPTVAPRGIGSAGGPGPAAVLPVIRPDRLAWTDLGETPATGYDVVDVVSRRYVVRHTADERAVEVRRRADNRLVVRHRSSDPEWTPAFADMAGDRLVLVEGSYEPGPARLYVYDLRTGRRVADLARTAPPHSPLPQMTTVTDDGRLFYGATVKGRGESAFNCVAMVDLNTWVTTLVECAADGSSEEVGKFLYASEDGAAWVRGNAQDGGSCSGGSGIWGQRLITIAECRTFAVTFVGGWSVWSTGEFTGSFDANMPLRASDGDRTVDLGRVESWRLTTCGRYAYWIPPMSGGTNRLLRWRPGLPHVEVAYESTSSDIGGADQMIGGCSDGILTIQLVVDPGNDPRVRVMALDSTV
jgi:hypothetical protein